MIKKLLLILGGLALTTGIVFSAVTPGVNGGTGISTSTAANDGKFLQQASSSPFLTWQFASPAGSATTTINGVSGPTFTFSIVATTSASSITTTTAQLFLNLLRYSSSSQITITPTGTIVFATTSVSQFVNDRGYLTSAPATTTLLAHGTATGPAITFATSSASADISCASATCTFSIPTNTNQLTNGAGFITGNQTINLTGPVTGSGATSIATTITSPLIVATANHTTVNVTTTIVDAGTASIGTTTASGTLNVVGTSIFNGSVFILPTSTFLAADSTGKVVATGTPSASLTAFISAFNVAIISSASSSQTSTVNSFTIPSGVNSLIVTANGAAGFSANSGANIGGKGGQTISTIFVNSGTTYYYYVGAHGAQSSSAHGNAGAGGTGGGATGAQGGEMTWLGTANTFSTTTVLLAAAGGGGSVTGCNSGVGGDGGGTTGSNGTGNGTVGAGGTQSAGGTGANAGTAGQGGAGQAGGGGCGGGGGGGGFFGGGGGSNGAAGGGGGSSFVTSTNIMYATSTVTGGANNASTSNSTFSDGSITIVGYGVTTR